MHHDCRTPPLATVRTTACRFRAVNRLRSRSPAAVLALHHHQQPTHSTHRNIGSHYSCNPIGNSYVGLPGIVIGSDAELEFPRTIVFGHQVVAPVGQSHITPLVRNGWDAEVTDGIGR